MIARRDIVKLSAGAVAGTLLTPVPWKLLDDSAIWSQNWSWIPKLPKGEIKVKNSTCTLCPAGCGVRARCVGEQPVSLEGDSDHPLSRGALCPVGVAGHHMAFHPRRVRQPLARAADGKLGPVSADQAAAAIAAAAANARGRVAFLDPRPGRAVSGLYRAFVREFEGIYLATPEREEVTLQAVAAMTGQKPRSFGFDLEHARTILSFGAPLLDGWATPGRVHQRRGSLYIIQVEGRQSRTAIAADEWIPLQPGMEASFALEIARALQGEPASPQASAVARRLKEDGPAMVVGGGDPGAGPFDAATESAIARLNLLVPTPAIVSRARLDELEIARIHTAADHSIQVLFIDASAPADPLPWEAITRTLTDSAIVVAFSDRVDGLARHAQYIIPSPSHFESMQEAPTPPCSQVASFSIAPALQTATPGAIEPVEFLNRLSSEKRSAAEALKQRAASVYALKRGTVYADSKSQALADLTSVDDFWKLLAAGGCWVDECGKSLPKDRGLVPEIAQPMPPTNDPKYPFALLPFGWRASTGWLETTPLLTKVYQESGLRESSIHARVHPDDAATLGLKQNDVVLLETRCGSCRRVLAIDPAVLPGVVEVAVGPAPPGRDAAADPRQVIDVCNVDSACTWRASQAAIRRAS